MKAIKNILGVALSNVSGILSGVLVGFLIPKVLSVEGYGLYKTFTLYVSYLGMFSLGIVDGVYLKYGAKDYEELSRPLFRSYFKWFILIHVAFSLLAVITASTIDDANLRFILIMLGLNLIAVNVTGYFQHVSQITQRFKEYSLRKIIQSTLNVCIVAVLYLQYIKNGLVDYQIYVIAIVAMNYALMCWYVITYRELVFGEAIELGKTKSEIINLIMIGFPLLFANLCSTLLLTIDRQFVNILFSTEQYAVYAFAYNMLSLVTVATSAVSTVLYPLLKRKNKDESNELYPMLSAVVLVMVYFIIVAYFPLRLFINWFLPKYTASLTIFRIILPGIAISSVITVIMHNYYKVMNKNLLYFRKSLVVLFLSAVANYVAFKLFGTMESISVASIVTMVFWYLFVEKDLYDVDQVACHKNRFFAVAMMCLFYSSSAVENTWVGLLLYFVLFIVIVISFYKKQLENWKSIVFRR